MTVVFALGFLLGSIVGVCAFAYITVKEMDKVDNER